MDGQFSIQPYLNNIHILNETVKQIQKDFGFFSLKIGFTGNKDSAFDELLEQIAPHIKRLMETDYIKFLSLLYRIDVNEKQLKSIPGREPEKEIAELIIKRCLQKVVYKKLFS